MATNELKNSLQTNNQKLINIEGDINQILDRLDNFNDTITDLNGQLTSLRSENSTLIDQRDNLEEEIFQLEGQLNTYLNTLTIADTAKVLNGIKEGGTIKGLTSQDESITINSITNYGSYGFFPRFDDSNILWYMSEDISDYEAALCNVSFTVHRDGASLEIDAYQEAETSYDYAIFSNLDQTLLTSNTVDSAYTTLQSKQYQTTRVKYSNLTAGEHFITIKFRKDQSQSTGRDMMEFTFIGFNIEKYQSLKQQISTAVPELDPESIRKGSNILGVEGIFEAKTLSEYLQSSSDWNDYSIIYSGDAYINMIPPYDTEYTGIDATIHNNGSNDIVIGYLVLSGPKKAYVIGKAFSKYNNGYKILVRLIPNPENSDYSKEGLGITYDQNDIKGTITMDGEYKEYNINGNHLLDIGEVEVGPDNPFFILVFVVVPGTEEIQLTFDPFVLESYY